MENKILKGLCYLGETSLLLPHPLVHCDSLGCSYMGPPFPFYTSVVWLVSVCQASVDLITSPRLCSESTSVFWGGSLDHLPRAPVSNL